jgi:7-carboxy-7-deazaguanine synthase
MPARGTRADWTNPEVEATPGDSLVVNEIFLSIQGESTHAGEPCAFVRTTACNLRCAWCDTAYAFEEGRVRTLDEIVFEVDRLGVTLVELTGGEPLLQKGTPVLARRLLDRGYRVMIETGGALPIDVLDRRVIRILDVKCPGSGMDATNRLENLAALDSKDQVKFVLRDRADFEWARDFAARHRLAERVTVLFSPVHGEMDAAALSKWILDEGLPVRLNLQIHKFVWGPDARGV